MRAILLPFAVMLLAGCWLGGDFYTAADLRQPVPPGTYRLTAPGGPGPARVRVSPGPGGYTQVVFENDPDSAGRVGIAALDAEGRGFAIWPVRENEGSEPRGQVYALLGRMDDGTYRILRPPACGGGESVPAGASVDAIAGVCRFRTRAALEAALIRLIPRLDQGATLVRVATP